MSCSITLCRLVEPSELEAVEYELRRHDKPEYRAAVLAWLLDLYNANFKRDVANEVEYCAGCRKVVVVRWKSWSGMCQDCRNATETPLDVEFRKLMRSLDNLPGNVTDRRKAFTREQSADIRQQLVTQLAQRSETVTVAIPNQFGGRTQYTIQPTRSKDTERAIKSLLPASDAKVVAELLYN